MKAESYHVAGILLTDAYLDGWGLDTKLWKHYNRRLHDQSGRLEQQLYPVMDLLNCMVHTRMRHGNSLSQDLLLF